MAAPTYLRTDHAANEGFYPSDPSGTTSASESVVIPAGCNTLILGYQLDQFNSTLSIDDLSLTVDGVVRVPKFEFSEGYGERRDGVGAQSNIVNYVCSFDVSNISGAGATGTAGITLSQSSSANGAFFTICSTGFCISATKNADLINNLTFDAYSALIDTSILKLNLGDVSSFSTFDQSPVEPGAEIILKNTDGSTSVCAVSVPVLSSGLVRSVYDISSPSDRFSNNFFMFFRNSEQANTFSIIDSLSDDTAFAAIFD